jgi:hypothetical protein
MQETTRRLGLRLPYGYYSVLGIPPREGEPHLPAEITGAIVGEMLDRIATTFKGVVQFGWCENVGLYDIDFMSVKEVVER